MGQHGWKLILGCICVSLVSLVYTYYAEGHNTAIIQCRQNIIYDHAVKVGEDRLLTNGLYEEHYDTNDDGKFDILTLSYEASPKAGDSNYHNPNPVFWIVDIDFDGTPDAIYIDKQGLGKCTDIVLYEDLNNQPYTEEKPMLNRGGRL